MAKPIGARELKTRLGTYIRQVRNGRTIIVTERGEPVAELRPLGRSMKGEAKKLEDLIALGVVSRASMDPLASFTPIRVAGRPVSEAIVEDREDRF